MPSAVKTPERAVIRWVCVLFVLACFLPCIDCGPEVPSGDPGNILPTARWQFGLLILLFGAEKGTS